MKSSKIKISTINSASGYAVMLCLAALIVQPAHAQDTEEQQSNRGGAAALMSDEVIVTATKRAESIQDVPLAVTAFGADQLNAIGFKDIGSLGFSVPNVALDDNGTSKGFANFSIRGLGTNSSIPSIDPTVGLFVDGVYQGIAAGQIFDNFDLEAIEILRGPQGVLFGRNVTGGAVIVRTRKPSDELELRGRIGVETGLRVVANASISGPIVEGVLTGKLAAYYAKDNGWHTNQFDNSEFGKDRQFIIRPSLRWTPSETVEMLLRYEHGEGEGDGPATQNQAIFSRDSHDFAIDEPGNYKNTWDSLTFETNIDVGFGDGTITNIFGWRQFEGGGLSDIDGTTAGVFHIDTLADQNQWSNELRYAGGFKSVDVTTGLYYFTQDLSYFERRILGGGAVLRDGGGIGTFDTFGIFGAIDWHATDTLTLNLGLRYTKENKDVDIATIRTGGGDINAKTLITDFSDDEEWTNFSPRVGAQWEPNNNTQVYAYYAKGFRSGGYNFRNTVAGAPPGPFSEETQNAFELGVKQKFWDGRGRVNLAVYQSTIDDIQREVQFPVPAVGIAQLIRNVGKARIRGFEGEVSVGITENVVIAGHVGHTSGEYQSLNVDITGDGVVNAVDFALELPRLSPWTFGMSATMDIPLGNNDVITTRLAYSHRDRAFHTDDNRGFYSPIDMVDATLTYAPGNGPLTYSIYGKNLTDETTYGNNAVLPDIGLFGGDGAAGPRGLPTFGPLGRGRVIGAEIRFEY